MARWIVELVGALASVLSVASFVPQAWRVVKTRSTESLSAATFTLNTLGFALWVGYGAMLGSWPIIATNSICGALACFILLMKVLPRRSKEKVADVLDPAIDSRTGRPRDGESS